MARVVLSCLDAQPRNALKGLLVRYRVTRSPIETLTVTLVATPHHFKAFLVQLRRHRFSPHRFYVISLSPLVLCPTPWSKPQSLGLSIQHHMRSRNEFTLRGCSRSLSSQQRSFPFQHGRVSPSRLSLHVTRPVAAQAESFQSLSTATEEQDQQEQRSSQHGITFDLPTQNSAGFLADRVPSTLNTSVHVSLSL
jgi:hypothetical protein